MSFVARLANIFLAPGEVFSAIADRRDWRDLWIPLIILIVAGIVSTAVLDDVSVDYKLDMLERAIENSDRIPDEQKAEIIANRTDKILNPSLFSRFMGYFQAALMNPIRILFWALVALMVGNFILGGGAKYKDHLVNSGYIYLIVVLELVVKIPIMLYNWDLNVSTGLGLLGIGELGDFIYHFLAQIDIFAIWRIILFGIGLGVIYKKSSGSYLIAMTVVWLIIISINAVLGAAFV